MSLGFRDLLLKLLEKNPDRRISLEETKAHDFFRETDWSKVEARQNDPPLKEIIEKHDYIKFRDATAEKYIRREVNKSKTLKDNYQIKLYEFRNSE